MNDSVRAGIVEVSDAPQTSRGTYRKLMRNTSFRRLWLSGLISGVGDWLVIGFLMPLVTQLSGGSSFAVAGILIAKILPSLFLSSIIGSLVDRFDRRRTMIFANIVQATLILGLVFTNSLALIYTIVLVTEIAALFFAPARNALIPLLVEEEQIVAANGLAYTTQQGSMLLGLTASAAILAVFERVVHVVVDSGFPIVGGFAGWLAPELLGPRAGVFVDSLTFLASALLITMIKVRHSGRGVSGLDLKLVGKDVVEAYRFLIGHPELRRFLVTIGLAILGGGAIVPVGLIHVQQNLTGGIPFLESVPALERLVATPQTFMMVFLALGMVSGALVVPKLADRFSLQLLFLGGVTGFGVSMLGFASAEKYWLASMLAVCAGFFIADVSVAGYTYVHKTVGEEIQGRVFTALEAVVKIALLVSMIVTAPLADLMDGLVRLVVDVRDIAPSAVVLTGSRLTLQLASLVVIAAAYYAYRGLDWRRSNVKGPDV